MEAIFHTKNISDFLYKLFGEQWERRCIDVIWGKSQEYMARVS